MRLILFLLSLTSTVALANSEGGGHHGSAADLIAPAVNVAILIGILVWKLKTPLRNYFVTMSENVSNTLERASNKSKEAQVMLENEQRKLMNLENEVKNIKQQSANDVATYEKNLARETEEKTHKLKADAQTKIQADKKAIMDDLNAELLNQVIAKTKTTIKGNKDYQSRVSNKLLQGLKQ